MMAVDDTADLNSPFGVSRLLFESNPASYIRNFPVRGYDITSDGKHFLLIASEEQQPQPVAQINIILNWIEELKRLCPTGK